MSEWVGDLHISTHSHTSLHSLTHSLTRSPTHSLTHSLNPLNSCMYAPTLSLCHSLTRPSWCRTTPSPLPPPPGPPPQLTTTSTSESAMVHSPVCGKPPALPTQWTWPSRLWTWSKSPHLLKIFCKKSRQCDCVIM